MTHQHQTAHFFDDNRKVGPLVIFAVFAWVALLTFAGTSAAPAPGQARAHGGGAYSSLIPVSDYLW